LGRCNKGSNGMNKILVMPVNTDEAAEIYQNAVLTTTERRYIIESFLPIPKEKKDDAEYKPKLLKKIYLPSEKYRIEEEF